MAVVLVATLDTKGEELGEVRSVLTSAGLASIVIDAGSAGQPQISVDIARERVFEAAAVPAVKRLRRRPPA